MVEESKRGIVHLLVNAAMEGYMKIGRPSGDVPEDVTYRLLVSLALAAVLATTACIGNGNSSMSPTIFPTLSEEPASPSLPPPEPQSTTTSPSPRPALQASARPSPSPAPEPLPEATLIPQPSSLHEPTVARTPMASPTPSAPPLPATTPSLSPTPTPTAPPRSMSPWGW